MWRSNPVNIPAEQVLLLNAPVLFVYAEINNQETFEILLKIYFANYLNFDLEFSFVSSGFALAKKLNNNELNSPRKIPSRKLGVKNLMWKILK